MPTMAEFERRLADLVDSLGFGPTTQATRAGRPNPEMRSYEPSAGENAGLAVNQLLRGISPQLADRLGDSANAFVHYGPLPAQVATDVAMQPVRAGEAVGEAVNDPTLANVTNAGVQTALAVGRPLTAVGVLGGGYLEALRRDLGVGPVSSAEAAPPAKGKKEQRLYEGLNADQSARLDELRSKIDARSASRAERQEFEELNAIVRDLQRKRNTAGADEYERAVRMAEAARDRELARDWRFADQKEVGALYQKTGGLAPMAAGFGTGLLSRAATGGARNAFYNYALPAGLGTLAGIGMANLPLAADAMIPPSYNPEKAAYLAYARELPPGHPRKQEFEDYAARLPDENPVRTAAAREFYDPTKLGERAAMGGAEGLLGGMLGADVVRIGSRAAGGIGQGVRNAFARGGSSPPVLPPPPPAAPPRNLMKIRDRNGVVRYWDEDVKRWVKRSDVE